MILRKPLTALSLVLAALLSAEARAQGTANTNVGLTVSAVGFQFGVPCGPFQCSYVQGSLPAGTRATLTAWGAPRTPFAIGISLPTNTCRRVPGILNGLLLGRPIITHAVGLVGAANPNVFCPLGTTNVPLGIPPFLSRFQFAIQSVGLDPRATPLGGAAPAFSNPILIAVQ